MKKFQMDTLALVAVLAIGGGSVFAAEKVAQQKSVTVDGIEIASEDEALLKAVENREIKIIVDGTEAEEGIENVELVESAENVENVEKVIDPKSVTVDGIAISSEDEALLKAVENKEVKISVA